MRPTLILSLACLATVAAGCSDEKSASERSGELPDNLCEAVTPAMPDDWGLTETSNDRDETTASCTVADEEGGTRLVLTLITPASGDVDAAFAELCDTYLVNPQERDDERCTSTAPAKTEGLRTSLEQAVRLSSPSAVLWMTFQTNDPGHAAAALDVLSDVEAALSKG